MARETKAPSSNASIEDAGAAEAAEHMAVVKVMAEASSASATGPTDDLPKNRYVTTKHARTSEAIHMLM